MECVSKRQQPHQDENFCPWPPIGLQWTTRKSSYHKAGCSWPRNIIIHMYMYSYRSAPIYSINTGKVDQSMSGLASHCSFWGKCNKKSVLDRCTELQNIIPVKISQSKFPNNMHKVIRCSCYKSILINSVPRFWGVWWQADTSWFIVNI